jgi:hypothetical protein
MFLRAVGDVRRWRGDSLAVLTRMTLVLCVLGLIHTSALLAQQAPALAERARGAEHVVVGHVTTVTPVWRTNDFGDRLIVSVVHVSVEETLKGPSRPSVDVEVEGGTIGNLTLRVSDLATFAPGDRVVFYLKHSRRGTLVPHLRGLGLLKLDRSGRVQGSSLTLDQVRRETAAGVSR